MCASINLSQLRLSVRRLEQEIAEPCCREVSALLARNPMKSEGNKQREYPRRPRAVQYWACGEREGDVVKRQRGQPRPGSVSSEAQSPVSGVPRPA
ncbi:hypothetical protein O3P69_006564 [Scylla paramamosain]|uniref:Uncharacterized protein n=1 Tax=Scylla paramamosain TaxID=85552 RepID=A0AAW0U4I2_SCYPA